MTDLTSQGYCWYVGLHTLEVAYNLPAAFAPYPGIFPEELSHCLVGARETGQSNDVNSK